MGRVKIAKKSTFIDMTAMSDVTVLLLTFFMLTSTFLQKEPVTVVTPASVSEEKVQETNVVQVLVSPKGQVWLSMVNDTSQVWSNDSMRMEVLVKAAQIYNDQRHPKVPLEFSKDQQKAFSKLSTFGVPLVQMGEFLDLAKTQEGITKMDQWLAGEDNDANHISGIPIDDGRGKENEFQIWMRAMRQTSNENLKQAIKEGSGVAIKADKNTSYEDVYRVMDNLVTIKMNKFTLLTALKALE